MRATSEDQQLAESVGLRVRVILAVTWGIAALLAGVAGVMQAGASNSTALDTNLHFVALRAFPAVLLGGLESITGALVGGLILGLTEEWAKMLFSGEIATELAPYVVLMVVLVIRPEGLFGEQRIERI
jgi:branched-chain amino acid transport system permease protein